MVLWFDIWCKKRVAIPMSTYLPSLIQVQDQSRRLPTRENGTYEPGFRAERGLHHCCSYDPENHIIRKMASANLKLFLGRRNGRRLEIGRDWSTTRARNRHRPLASSCTCTTEFSQYRWEVSYTRHYAAMLKS